MAKVFSSYEAARLSALRTACPWVSIEASYDDVRERWRLMGNWNGGLVIRVVKQTLVAACDSFRVAYSTAVANGMVKPGSARAAVGS